MGFRDVPFITAKNTASKRNVLSVFSGAYSAKKRIAWCGDSMSTLYGGSGHYMANHLLRWSQKAYGSLWSTPLLYGRPALGNTSVCGFGHNVINNDARVTTINLPANVRESSFALGDYNANKGIVVVYDPQLLYAYDNVNSPGSFASAKLMKTSGTMTFKPYLSTRSGAGAMEVYRRNYTQTDAISIGGYGTTVGTNYVFGQSAAEGSVVTTDISIASVSLSATQMLALQVGTAGTRTDWLGGRFVDPDVTRGISFDMYGRGGDDSVEYQTAQYGSWGNLNTISAPDAIVLRFGMNDAFLGGTAASNYNTGVRALIDDIRAAIPGIPIIIWGTTASSTLSYNNNIDLQPAAAQSITADYDDVAAVNTRLVYDDAAGYDYTTEGLTVSTAWATATSYTAGTNRTDAGRAWQCVTNHTSASDNQMPSVYWKEVNRTTVDGIHLNPFGARSEASVLDRVLIEASAVAQQRSWSGVV